MFEGRNLDYQWEEVFATVIEEFDSKGVVSEIRTSGPRQRMQVYGSTCRVRWEENRIISEYAVIRAEWIVGKHKATTEPAFPV